MVIDNSHLLVMKIDHFYWWAAIKHNARGSLRIQYKKIDTQFIRLLKEKKLLIHKKYINNIYTKLSCASNGKKIIFHFYKYIENR
jgi:hypothetical protein